MRYTHSLHTVHHRRHRLKISAILSVILTITIAVMGYTVLDARAFFTGFIISLVRITTSYFISLVLAVMITLWVTSNKRVEDAIVPVLDVLQSFPSFALFPILAQFFGRSEIVTILILVVTMVWPLIFTILTSQKQINHEIFEAAEIFGARGWRRIWYVLLPLLTPSIVTGSIIAWGEAWEAVVAVEIIVGGAGLGTYLNAAGEAHETRVVLVGVLLLLMLLFLINKYVWLNFLSASVKSTEE